MFRDDGATSTEAWVAERFGVSAPTARASPTWQRRSSSCPHLVGVLALGDISFDKVRAVVDVATPETDRAALHQAKERTCP